MEKVYVIGKNDEKVNSLKNRLRQYFVYSEKNPDLIIAYGGDGTLLIAERQFPGVKKILLRDSYTCKNGHEDIDGVIKKYLCNDYKIKEINKLKAVAHTSNGIRELIAMNDIVIRNTLPTEAIRFILEINKGGDENEDGKEYIGDGVVISTPYGSGAYFHSITKEKFDEGIGLAFNNLTEKERHIILNNKDNINIKITRGPGVLVSDNNRDFVNLEHEDYVTIEQLEESAKVLVFE